MSANAFRDTSRPVNNLQTDVDAARSQPKQRWHQGCLFCGQADETGLVSAFPQFA
jgi:hypothetical protein